MFPPGARSRGTDQGDRGLILKSDENLEWVLGGYGEAARKSLNSHHHWQHAWSASVSLSDHTLYTLSTYTYDPVRYTLYAYDVSYRETLAVKYPHARPELSFSGDASQLDPRATRRSDGQLSVFVSPNLLAAPQQRKHREESNLHLMCIRRCEMRCVCTRPGILLYSSTVVWVCHSYCTVLL
jgi:hypothetical protein